MNFVDEIKSFIAEIYSGAVICDNISDEKFTRLFLPEKKLQFVLIAMPTKSYGGQYKCFFQQISIDAFRQNLRSVMLWEDIWRNRNQIVKQRIAVHLGKFCRIHARLCEVHRISKAELDNFLNENNMYGSPTAKNKYALKYNDEIVAVASFSGGRPINRNGEIFRSYEIVRFANLAGYVVTGGVGKLVSHFIAEHHPDDIMSYADFDWSSGDSYQRLGFKFVEFTEPQTFYIDTKNGTRYSSHKMPKEWAVEALAQAIDVDEYLEKQKIFKIYNSGNLKYLLLLKKSGSNGTEN